jgi:serine/threonine protein kinase
MEKCPSCKKNIDSVKLLKCKFCEIPFCSLSCLVKHASYHLKNDFPQKNILNSLKRRQSENLTEHYSFLTSGDFREKPEYDKIYSKDNFSKVLINDIFPCELGSGSFGRVYLIKHKINNEEYAQKVIEKKKLIQMYGKVDIIKNEISIHSKLLHENIIRLYNVYEDESKISFIMEYAKNGNLYELLSKQENKKGFDEQRAFDYFIQIVNAVYYLHQNNIIHRDIKPENILIGKKGLLKLCDFGWAKELNLENRSTFCGTVEYMAPEIVGSENYDYSVDIWSLGILLYELLFGHSPFKAKNMKSVILNIKSHDLTYDKPITPECKDIIKRILNSNPQKRLKLKDILDHPFVKKYSKNYLCRKVLEFNYNNKEINLYMNNYNNNNNGIINNYIISEKKINEKNGEDIQLFTKQRCNTKYVGSKTRSIFKNININNDKIEKSEQKTKKNLKKAFSLLCINDGNIKKIKTQKERNQTEKKLLYIEKLRNSFYVELEKMKQKIDSISFKNTECCTFEDVRDVQLSNQKLKQYDEKKKGKIKKISLEGVINKSKSSCYIFNKDYNTEKKIFSKENKEKNESQNESELTGLFDNIEEKKMVERLYKAYKKFGKNKEENNKEIIKNDKNSIVKNLFLSYE